MANFLLALSQSIPWAVGHGSDTSHRTKRSQEDKVMVVSSRIRVHARRRRPMDANTSKFLPFSFIFSGILCATMLCGCGADRVTGVEDIKSQAVKVLTGFSVNNLELQEAVFDVLVRGYAEPKRMDSDPALNVPLEQSNNQKDKYKKELLYRARLQITYGIHLAKLNIEPPSISSNKMIIVLDEPSMLSSKTLTADASDKKIGILAVKGESYWSGSVPRAEMDHQIESYLVSNSGVVGDKLMGELIPSMKVQTQEILSSLLNPVLRDAGMVLEIKWNTIRKPHQEDVFSSRTIELPVGKEVSE